MLRIASQHTDSGNISTHRENNGNIMIIYLNTQRTLWQHYDHVSTYKEYDGNIMTRLHSPQHLPPVERLSPCITHRF